MLRKILTLLMLLAFISPFQVTPASAAATSTVTGTITNVGGQPMAGVTVSVDGGAITTTTAANGGYSVGGLADGEHIFTPSLAGTYFSLANQSVPVPYITTGVNFQGSATPYPSISGTVLDEYGDPLPGVEILIVSTSYGAAGVFTDENGQYSLPGFRPGSYTLMPYLDHYNFAPANGAATVVDADVSGVDFTATAIRYSVSGTLQVGDAGLPDATVSAVSTDPNGPDPVSTTTGSDGYYVLSLTYSTYTISPSKNGYVFDPESQSVTPDADVSGVDFAATQVLYTLSGRVCDGLSNPVAGVTIALTGGASTSSAADGTYSISGLTAGDYTVTPSLKSYTFAPASRDVTLGPDTANVDFTATYNIYTLYGSVKDGSDQAIAGVTISARAENGTTVTASTDGSGAYSIPNLETGSYTVTPSKNSYTFAPASTGLTLSADTQVDFTGTYHTYSISGKVQLGSLGMPGVALTLSPGGATTTSASDGTYLISNLEAGDYTVTPSYTNFDFTPPSRQVTLGPGNATSVDFSASEHLYQVSGRVVRSENTSIGIQGVTLSVSPGGQTATSDADGNYTLGLIAGSYTLTPGLAEYSFIPDSQTVNVTGDKSGVNFTGVQSTYSISGLITSNGNPLAGVTVTASPGGAHANSGSDGRYTLSGLYKGDYTLTPSKAEYTFSPNNQSVSVGPSVTTANFSATLNSYTLGGTIQVGDTPLEGVSVEIEPGSHLVTTGADGAYSVSGLLANTYTVTPALAEYTFDPANCNVTLGPSRTDVDFSATLNTYSVSGTITVGDAPLEGVSVSAGGGKSAVTGADGKYTLGGLVKGDYTVTPTLAEYTFDPVSMDVSVGPSQTGVDFSATQITYSVSGIITVGNAPLEGVTVSTGGGKSAATGADGQYTLSGLVKGDYTLTPALAEYSFDPLSQDISVGPDQTGVDFSATLGTYSISGTITVGDAPLEGVTVTAGGGKSAVTDADGKYTLSGLVKGDYTVTPALAEYSFDPLSQDVSVGPDQTGVDFTATQNTYSVSGKVTAADGVTPIAGVLISTYAGGPTALTAVDGTYTLSGLLKGSYTLTPSKAGVVFNPAYCMRAVGPDATDADFSGAWRVYLPMTVR